jgi:hypothetical protein
MIGYNEQGQAFFLCSGTLVTLKLFVTAAHCTGGLPDLVPSEVRVVFDSRLTSFNPSVYVTGKAYPNPGFQYQGGPITYEQRSEDYGVVVLTVLRTRSFQP